ncbi:MAG: histidine kinase dimerization/phosphoacceptor domain -containing protein [Crocinitomicaceae bacterium]
MIQLRSILILINLCLLAGTTLSQIEAGPSFNSENQEDQIRNYLETSESLRDDDNPDSALQLLYNAELLAEGLQDKVLLAEVKYQIGYSLGKQSKHQDAIHFFSQAIPLYTELKDTIGLASTYNRLGVSYKYISVFSKAINCLNLSYKYFIMAGDSLGQGSTKLNLGNVFKNIGNSEMAKKNYREAIFIYTQQNDSNAIASCYNNLGNVFKNEDQFDSSFYYMYKTLEIRRKTKHKPGLSFIYHNIANLFLRVNDPANAKLYIDSSFQIKSERNDLYGICTDYEVNARISAANKNWNEAIEYGEKALDLARPFNDLDMNMEILSNLAFACNQLKQYEKSSNYFIEYIDAQETVKALNGSNQVEFALIEYEMVADSIQQRQMQLQKELQDAENENEKLSNEVFKRNFYLILAALLITIAIITFIYLANRKRLRKSRIEKETLEKTSVPKEEREVLLKEVHHRVKNNFQIINSLIRIQSEYITPSNYVQKLRELENRIRSMSLIHEKLYKTESLSKLKVKEYFVDLISNVQDSYEQSDHIEITQHIDSAEFGIDSLIPLGLIVNETISNSLKHAFEGKDGGEINISLNNTDEKTILTIKDNGIGADMTLSELKEESLGMELIYDLTDQLDGKITLSTERGFEYRFIFPRLK